MASESQQQPDARPAMDRMTRRAFVAASALAAAAPAQAKPDTSGILNYNPDMEYRRLGKTGLMVSAVCLGGHWKRVGVMIRPGFKGAGFMKEDFANLNDADFIRNRTEVVDHCIGRGINYVDACSPQEILAYAKVIRGRRDKIYFGFSWHVREPRFPEWRDAKKLVEGLDMSMKEAGLDYVDLWRISLPMEGISDLGTLRRVEQATAGALEQARRQGKVRFTGVSTHNRTWLRSVIKEFPSEIQVVLFPYTATSKELPKDSLFAAIKEHDVGAFGIKPFADNSLFSGGSAPDDPNAAEDDRKARLAIRNILGNPAITAPIPGLINIHQVDNAVQAVKERRELDLKEKAELEEAGRKMWAGLRPGYEWLRDWEYV